MATNIDPVILEHLHLAAAATHRFLTNPRLGSEVTIKHAFLGGYEIRLIAGHARATQDVDVVVEATHAVPFEDIVDLFTSSSEYGVEFSAFPVI